MTPQEQREFDKEFPSLFSESVLFKGEIDYSESDRVKSSISSLIATREREWAKNLREKIRNMKKRNLGSIQYEEKYVRWNSFGWEVGVDDLLEELIQDKKQK